MRILNGDDSMRDNYSEFWASSIRRADSGMHEHEGARHRKIESVDYKNEPDFSAFASFDSHKLIF